MCKKDYLRHIAFEINLNINDKITTADLNAVIDNSAKYTKKNNNNNKQAALVTDIAKNMIQNRKNKEQRPFDIEKIKIERL